MGARTPGEIHEQFAKFFNSKDVEGLLTLYEDDAVLVVAPGQTARGKDEIRATYEAFFMMNGTITFTAEAEPFECGDIALTHAKWTIDAPGLDAIVASTAEIARRGADGLWRYVVDNPVGTAVLGTE